MTLKKRLLGGNPSFMYLFILRLLKKTQKKKKRKVVEIAGTTVRPFLEARAVVPSQQKSTIVKDHGHTVSSTMARGILKKREGVWTDDTTGSPW